MTLMLGQLKQYICREKARVASAMLAMEVQASEVRLHWREPQEGDKLRYRHSQELQGKGQEGSEDGHSMHSSCEALRQMMQSFAPPETFIAAIAHLHVHETRPLPNVTPAKGQDPAKR